MRYRFTRPDRDSLADGRTLAFGDYVDLSRTARAEPHNARLIETGALKPAPRPTPPTTNRSSR